MYVVISIGVRVDFLGGGLNQFCPKNPGQSGNFSGRTIARLPEKKSFCPTLGAAAFQPPAHTPLAVSEHVHTYSCLVLIIVEMVSPVLLCTKRVNDLLCNYRLRAIAYCSFVTIVNVNVKGRLRHRWNTLLIRRSNTFSDSPLCTSITPLHFHSRLKTYLFHKSYPRSFTSSRTASTDLFLHRFF